MKLWLASGGRCQYPGCPEKLWEDEVTLKELNKSYIAHIEAVSKKGARYNSYLSTKTLNSFSNLMLLCDTHHRMIDNVDENGEQPETHHPVDLLKKYKRDHEERIEFMTSLTVSRSSYPMILKSNINKYKINVDLDDIREAMLPDRRPKSKQIIEIDLTKSSIIEEDDDFWELNLREIKRQLNSKLDQGPDGEEINHLSIFPLGPIPLLIYFGKSLGDIIDANVYQKHRNPGGWQWKESDDDEFDYIQEFPDRKDERENEGVLKLSISGNIMKEQIPNELCNLPKFEFKADHPSTDFLDSFEKLELFKKEIRIFLKDIREKYSNINKLHLLAAIPCPLAIEFGRAYMSKIDPEIYLYNASSTNKRKFKEVLKLY